MSRKQKNYPVTFTKNGNSLAVNIPTKAKSEMNLTYNDSGMLILSDDGKSFSVRIDKRKKPP